MAETNTSRSGEPDHQGVPPSDNDHRHTRPSLQHRVSSSQPPAVATRNIVVVGVCSSGKSTLVRNLQEKGFQAHAVSQEHSYVPHLWQRTDPDVLIYLDASLHTIRGRGRTRWRQALLDEEHRRLHNAREHCDLYIPTDGLSPQDVASRVVTFLRKSEIRSQTTTR